ncbi:MAG: TraR/DksA family transcriptional regulator [Roseivirga sp.]|nr:TraR/DksA family transcriptional regulator [Roseivirga sp.]
MSIDKETLRENINLELQKVRKDITDLEELTKPISPENSIGRISRMDAINNKSVNEASLHQARDKYNKLEEALSRMDEAGFGLYVRCGEPIPEGRIMLMPHSRKCVRCA